MSSYLPNTSTILAAFTRTTMTVEQLAHNTMLTKPKVSEALQLLKEQGKVEVVGGAWTLLSLKKKGSTDVTPSTAKKAPAKKVAAKKTPAKKVAPAKKSLQVKKEASVKKVAPAKKAAATSKSAAAINGAKKHAKVAERDDKVLAAIVASKKLGITDEEIATNLGTTLGIAYQSVRRLKDEGKINSSKGDNGVTRRYAA